MVPGDALAKYVHHSFSVSLKKEFNFLLIEIGTFSDKYLFLK